MASHPLVTQSAKIAETVSALGEQLDTLQELRVAAFHDGTVNDDAIEEADWLPSLEQIVGRERHRDEEHGNVAPRWAAQRRLR